MASIEGLTGGMPMLNWDSADLPGAYKSFETHCRFMFEGPLKAKSEAEKCAYLMIWIGNKGREVYGTWTLTDDEQKSLETLFKKFEDYVKPNQTKFSTDTSFSVRNKVTLKRVSNLSQS